jgi:shikimate dehydrogenase
MLQVPASVGNQDSKLLTGLIGENILASRSPWLHEQEAVAQGLHLTYVLFDFAARGWTLKDLPRVLDAAQTIGFSGVNITHPFKQDVIPLLDELAPSARKVGAVNTVQFSGGKRIGHNTDVTGFAENVRTGLPGVKLNRVVQFGAGGGGSATAHALLGLGVRELIVIDSDANRRSSLAAQLKSEFPGTDIRDADDGAALLTSADGVVNATPVGMAAYPGTPFDTALLKPSQWVADIVYFPLETQLLAQARMKGCATLSGSGMAVFQAADAFDIFTGRKADRNRMLKSFDAFRDAQADCAA